MRLPIANPFPLCKEAFSNFLRLFGAARSLCRAIGIICDGAAETTDAVFGPRNRRNGHARSKLQHRSLRQETSSHLGPPRCIASLARASCPHRCAAGHLRLPRVPASPGFLDDPARPSDPVLRVPHRQANQASNSRLVGKAPAGQGRRIDAKSRRVRSDQYSVLFGNRCSIPEAGVGVFAIESAFRRFDRA
jgi:hypothetical protein